jgi:uncharacterized protein
MSSKTAQTLSCVVLLAMLVTYPLLMIAGERSLASMKNAPILWIPETFGGVQVFHDFVRRFDALEVVLVSWDGATIDDERLKRFADELRAKQAAKPGPRNYSDVVDGYSQSRDMMGPPLELSRSGVLRRLQGFLVGPDRSTSCAIVVLTEHGSTERDQTLEMIAGAAREVGLKPDELYLAGSPIDGFAIDRLSRRSLQLFAVPSAVVSFLLCWLCLRSFWFTVPVLLIAAYGQGLCLSLVYFTGGKMNAVLIVLPALVFVLSISAGIHLTNYFMEEVRMGRDGDAVNRAIRRAWLPSLLAAVTTAIGLVSLVVSNVEPVRQFGWVGATGVLACFSLLFLVMPGAMYRWQMTFGHAYKSATGDLAAPMAATPFWQRTTGLIASRHVMITAAGVSLLVATGWGLQHIRTAVDIMALLDPDVPEVRDSVWFQENIGPLVPVDVVVRFPKDSGVDIIDRVRLASQIHAGLNRVESIGGTISAATFVPPIPKDGGVRAVVGRSVLRNRIEAEKDDLIRTGYLREDADGQHWRIGGRAESRQDIDYADLLDTIRNEIQPIIDDFDSEQGVRLVTTYTGITSAIYEVQRALLADLFKSFLTAVALVTLVMVVAFRGIGAALLAMVPNVFPTFLMFGTLGWIDRAVDIGTVMTASVALGIAVDGTFHYLCSFRSEIAAGHSPLQAVAHSYQHCGRALLQTTLVCAVGILVYCFSSFLPARHFAISFVLLLILAAVGDLVLLPALLLGRAGRLFGGAEKGVEMQNLGEAEKRGGAGSHGEAV